MVRRRTRHGAQNSQYSQNLQKKGKKALRKKARKLLRDPRFLSRVLETIACMGVVGEKRNSLLLFVAALTAHQSDPVSVLVKGPSSSGKSNVVKAVLSLLPPKIVVDRSSLSSKAPAHGKIEWAGRILYLAEVRGGQDARFLLRLLQSEGAITHEYTYVQGRDRGTKVVTIKGKPVVVSTTTEARIFADDETRFLSIWVDGSEKQTLEIARSLVRKKLFRAPENLPAIREAVRVLLGRNVQIDLPTWFDSVARRLPAVVRTRRDFPRFLSLVKAVALIQSMSDKRRNESAIEVNLADYAVAYKLSNCAFSMTSIQSTETPEIVKVCREAFAELKCPITRKEIRKRTEWKAGLTHKRIKAALEAKLLKSVDSGPSNEKRYVPINEGSRDFLPRPKSIVKRHLELNGTRYVDPLSGKTKVIRLGRKDANAE